ncbi:hypothetical protein VB711_24630, partial [Cronbergia sp. UHCC 0137]|uniref:hypothetical protein n=1 Tax=Cronbergia sp. UHCC 0137 TaxID=3110239 RepID=UPI002B219EE9
LPQKCDRSHSTSKLRSLLTLHQKCDRSQLYINKCDRSQLYINNAISSPKQDITIHFDISKYYAPPP